MNNFKIIIPIFNVESTIKQTIWSVYNQSYKNWEVMIIDDNSNDKTIEQIQQFMNDISVEHLDLKRKFRLLKRDNSVGFVQNMVYGIDFYKECHDESDIFLILDRNCMLNSYNVLDYINLLYEKHIIATYGMVTFQYHMWATLKTNMLKINSMWKDIFKNYLIQSNHLNIKNIDFLLKTL
jgi:glycosyltransferase involved in cell wall biosynthesis